MGIMESPSSSPPSSPTSSYESFENNQGSEGDKLSVDKAKVRFPDKNWEDGELGEFEKVSQGIRFNIYAPSSVIALDPLREIPTYVSYRPNDQVSNCRSRVKSTFQSSLPNRIDLYTSDSPKVALSLSISNQDEYVSLLNYFKNNLKENKCSRIGGGRRKPVRRTKRTNKRKYKKKMTKRRKLKKRKTRRGKKGKRSSATR